MLDSDAFNIAASASTAVICAITIIAFFYSRRQKQFDILEQSFDILQRINEKALESNANVLAAIQSANPEDQTSVDKGRVIYFQYMRLNRVFRAYEYHRGRFLNRTQRDRIAAPAVGTLKSINTEQLDAMLQRGYPDDFAIYLRKAIAKAKVPDKLS